MTCFIIIAFIPNAPLPIGDALALIPNAPPPIGDAIGDALCAAARCNLAKPGRPAAVGSRSPADSSSVLLAPVSVAAIIFAAT